MIQYMWCDWRYKWDTIWKSYYIIGNKYYQVEEVNIIYKKCNKIKFIHDTYNIWVSINELVYHAHDTRDDKILFKIQLM